MHSLFEPLRFSIRSLAKAPLFTAVAAATLGLGIGANTAIFSIVRSVLLEPLPYSEPDRVVMVWNRWRGWDKTWLSVPEYLDYRELGRSWVELGAWTEGGANLTGGNAEPERVATASVTPSVFQALGVEAALGRAFTEEEGVPGRDAVAVLGHRLWQRRWGGDPAVIGRTIELDGRTRTVVGIMPARFALPLDFEPEGPTELWIPFAIDGATVDRSERGSHFLYALARLSPAATPEQASSELQSLARRFTEEGFYHPGMQFDTFAVPVREEVVGGVRPALLLMLAAVGLLLLIACSNVAHLALARSEGRRREIAIRAALGARRRRLVRELLTESVLLAVAGGALGVALAAGGARLLAAARPPSIPRLEGVALDLPVLAFTAALSLATGILFGLLPAFEASRLDLSRCLKEGASSIRSSRGSFRSALVVAEIALAVVLLIGAGLMLRSLGELLRIDPGFEPRNVLTARVSLPEARYPEMREVVAFHERLVELVRSLPGVRAAGAARALPLTGTIGDWGLDIEGRPEPPGEEIQADWQVVTPGYFEAIGIELVKGRFFTERDRADARPVAVVNETMERLYWPGGDALGARIRMGSDEERPWATVVGVVGDVAHNGIAAEIKQKFYRPHAQFPAATGGFAPRAMTLTVKSEREPAALTALLRREVRALDPALPLSDLRTMEEVLGESVSEPQFTAFLLACFAIAALVLAAIGIYGVMAYVVSERVHEIGLRMALGARAGQVLLSVLERAGLLAAIGVALGIGAALALTRLLGGLLYGVGAADPATYLIVPPVLIAVALLASYVPARRATRVDPALALRME